MSPETKLFLRQKIKWSSMKWDKLYAKYDITILLTNNYIVKFYISGKIFYYDIPKGKIRKEKGKWTTKIITFLKQEFKTNIPLRGMNNSLTSEQFFNDLEETAKEGIKKGFDI